MKNYHFTEENIKKVKTWKGYVDKGLYGNIKDIVDTYNEIFKDVYVKQNYTHCGSCLRKCCLKMYAAYEEMLADKENAEVVEENVVVAPVTKEEYDALEEKDPSVVYLVSNDNAPKEKVVPKRGRPRKNT